METLNIYLIHSSELKSRIKYINSTIDMIKKIAEENNYQIKVIIVNDPNKEFIENNIEFYNKSVKYDKEEGIKADEEFNKLITNLNVLQISNIEKHKAVYKVLQKEDELHFIIEDDVLVGEDYLNNIRELFKNLKNKFLKEWDILFTCIASINNQSIELIDSRIQYKFLLAKSSYFIKPKLAAKLYEYLQIYKYNLKTAISKYIWDNKDVKSYVLNKHVFLEGSKMGLFPSSLNSQNFLFQNINFVQLTRITNSDHITDEMFNEAEKIYNNPNIIQMKSPDFIHSMGLLYYKRKNYEKAKSFMLESCEKLYEQNGFVPKSSEILNNAINMYQYDQYMLEECKNKKSKYSPN
jgi:GR25 family glycosyltransferase involved in LPS biosynthesis